MSAKSVKKHIREQRSARRRAERAARRQRPESADAPADASPVTAAETPARAAAETHHDSQRPRRRWPVAPLVTGLSGAAVIGVAVASAGMNVTAGDREVAETVPAHYAASPAVASHAVCPVLPETAEDDSAETSTPAHRASALVFAAAGDESPEASWVTVTEDGAGESADVDDTVTSDDVESSPAVHNLLVHRHLMAGAEDLGSDPLMLSVPAAPEATPHDAPAALAGFTAVVDSESVSGLVSHRCASAQRSAWFLGPETGSGAVSEVQLTNPHQREATVQITTYDASGSTGQLGATSVVVPAQSHRTVHMSSLTEGQAQLAVHVQSSAAPVAAQVVSGRNDSGSAGGIDTLPAQHRPLTEHHMMGVAAGADERPQLWLYAPEGDSTAVELQVFGDDGQEAIETPGVFTIEPRSVTVVDLDGLAPGVYDVAVRTESPTLAAIRSAGQGPPEQDDAESAQFSSDLTWSAAAPRLTQGAGALIPAAGDTELRVRAVPEAADDQDTAEQAESTDQAAVGTLTYQLVDEQGRRTEDQSVDAHYPQSAVVSHEALAEQAEEAGLEGIFAVVVTETTGDLRAALFTADDSGGFSAEPLADISPAAQYVPLRFGR